jgi:deoxycytidylate deaminase
MPCARCAAVVIQHGIKRVVAPVAPAALQERWAEDMRLARMMFSEAGVELEIV